MILSTQTKIKPLKTKEDILAFFKHSKKYNNVYNIDFLAQGGEATVYRIEHTDLDELVVKCCIFDENASSI